MKLRVGIEAEDGAGDGVGVGVWGTRYSKEVCFFVSRTRLINKDIWYDTCGQEGTRRFKKAPEGSRRFKKVQERHQH